MAVNTPPPAATPWLELLPPHRLQAWLADQNVSLSFITYQIGATATPEALWWRICRRPSPRWHDASTGGQL
jgi:hypothetical protein